MRLERQTMANQRMIPAMSIKMTFCMFMSIISVRSGIDRPYIESSILTEVTDYLLPHHHLTSRCRIRFQLSYIIYPLISHLVIYIYRIIIEGKKNNRERKKKKRIKKQNKKWLQILKEYLHHRHKILFYL